MVFVIIKYFMSIWADIHLTIVFLFAVEKL